MNDTHRDCDGSCLSASRQGTPLSQLFVLATVAVLLSRHRLDAPPFLFYHPSTPVVMGVGTIIQLRAITLLEVDEDTQVEPIKH